VELGHILHIHYQPKEQSLRIEMKGITVSISLWIYPSPNEFHSFNSLCLHSLYLSVLFKTKKHFFHSITYCSELYNIIIGKKQSWYSEYNAMMHTHFKLPATESLVECKTSLFALLYLIQHSLTLLSRCSRYYHQCNHKKQTWNSLHIAELPRIHLEAF